MGYSNWRSASSALTFIYGHDNLKSLSCILPKFVMHVTKDQFSDMAEKNSKWPISCDFSHFTSIIWPCGHDNLERFSCILFKFVMLVNNKQFSDRFDNGRKKSKWPIYCYFLLFTSIIWTCGRDNLTSFPCILLKFVMHVTNDQFPDKFNNGWKKN